MPPPPRAPTSGSTFTGTHGNRPAIAWSRSSPRSYAAFRFPTNRGRSARTWSTGWSTSSGATGVRPRTRSTRRTSGSTSSRALGQEPARLSVQAVQMFVNQRLEAGDSVRKVQVMRSVLSAALSRAVREELVTRNVARHVELPEWHRSAVRPWTALEASASCRPGPTCCTGVRAADRLRASPRRGPRTALATISTSTPGSSASASRSSACRRTPPARSRPTRASGPAPIRHSPGRQLAAQANRQAAYRAGMGAPGRTLASSSPPGRVGRWSRATSPGPSAASARPMTYE